MVIKNIIKPIIFIFIFNTICLCNASIIRGYITDAKSNEPLIGANIMLKGTNMGIASDLDGAYMISNVPIGSYTLLAMLLDAGVILEHQRQVRNYHMQKIFYLLH